MFSPTDHWIVRCHPARTLLLLPLLRELGFTAWTPVAERQYRKARSKKIVRVPEPMLSSFIFVEMGDDPERCAARLDDLRWRLHLRVHKDVNGYCGVRNEHLEPLRLTEREAATFGIDNLVKEDAFEIGQRGTVAGNAFLGLQCTLVDRTRGNLLVMLDGAVTPITIKPALFCPLPDERK